MIILHLLKSFVNKEIVFKVYIYIILKRKETVQINSKKERKRSSREEAR